MSYLLRIESNGEMHQTSKVCTSYYTTIKLSSGKREKKIILKSTQ